MNLIEKVALARKRKVPGLQDKNNYLGIEVEFISKYSVRDFSILLAEANLSHKINIGTDGSIECDDIADDDEDYLDEDAEWYGLEARILVKEKELTKTLNAFQKVLKRADAWTNKTCGLHVHIDMRNRDGIKCADKLFESEGILFSIVPGYRKGNTYCRPSNGYILGVKNTVKMEQIRFWQKYTAINLQPLTRQKTIEIRLHEGTTNMQRVDYWCKFLLGIINSETPVTEKNYLKVGSIPKKVKTYVSGRYKKYSKSKAYNPDNEYDSDNW